MNTCRLRLLTFDVTNTLLKFKITPEKQYSEIGALYGIFCDSDDLTKNFKNNWNQMVKEHPNFGAKTGIGWEIWWKNLIMGTFRDSKPNIEKEKLEEISSHLIYAYKSFGFWQHCNGTLDLLSYLKHKGIPLGIISNFDPRLYGTLESGNLTHYFKFVITSYEFGIAKPDPRIFQEAMKLSKIANLKPKECLHIGDNFSLDYEGAKNAGWNAALISDMNTLKSDERIDPNSVFSSLFDLQKNFMASNGEKLIAESKL